MFRKETHITIGGTSEEGADCVVRFFVLERRE